MLLIIKITFAMASGWMMMFGKQQHSFGVPYYRVKRVTTYLGPTRAPLLYGKTKLYDLKEQQHGNLLR